MTDTSPSYLKLSISELQKRASEAKKRLALCILCPWKCQVDRLQGDLGRCRVPANPVVSSYSAQFGEEPQLVGYFGSGTIFFTHCNLECFFCQNWEISHGGEGREIGTDTLAALMINLQERKCHNINLVTPTPHVAAILEALPLAVEKGLHIPLVYNSGGYESPETLKLLEGIVDIYMPDFKYWDPETAHRCSGPEDYPERAREALREMQRQVGDLKTDDKKIAYRGLLVRHLVLPDNLAGTEEVVHFLAREVSPRCSINIMGQYHPAYKAHLHPPLDRILKRAELREAKKIAARAGLQPVR